jgi:hypothetical protein
VFAEALAALCSFGGGHVVVLPGLFVKDGTSVLLAFMFIAHAWGRGVILGVGFYCIYI